MQITMHKMHLNFMVFCYFIVIKGKNLSTICTQLVFFQPVCYIHTYTPHPRRDLCNCFFQLAWSYTIYITVMHAQRMVNMSKYESCFNTLPIQQRVLHTCFFLSIPEQTQLGGHFLVHSCIPSPHVLLHNPHVHGLH